MNSRSGYLFLLLFLLRKNELWKIENKINCKWLCERIEWNRIKFQPCKKRRCLLLKCWIIFIIMASFLSLQRDNEQFEIRKKIWNSEKKTKQIKKCTQCSYCQVHRHNRTYYNHVASDAMRCYAMQCVATVMQAWQKQHLMLFVIMEWKALCSDPKWMLMRIKRIDITK